nr:three-finger toxin [Psammophis schokari]
MLLALVVVTFVYLDSALPGPCYSCSGEYREDDEGCPDGENLCIIGENRDNSNGTIDIKGCAATCPTPEEKGEAVCCSKDNCNNYFQK